MGCFASETILSFMAVALGGGTLNYTGQIETFLITVATGMLLGLIFDFYRIIRGVFKPRWVLTSIADLAYWLLATVIVFTALLVGNWGEVRLYVFIGLFAGVLLYYRLISRHAIRLLIGIMRLTARVMRTVRLLAYYGLVRPSAIVIRTMVKPFRYVGRKISAYSKPPDQNIPPQ
jgi:spore cortex biosynthesis protein YabQ